LNDALLLLAYPLYDKSECRYPLEEYDCLTCGMGCFILRGPDTWWEKKGMHLLAK